VHLWLKLVTATMRLPIESPTFPYSGQSIVENAAYVNGAEQRPVWPFLSVEKGKRNMWSKNRFHESGRAGFVSFRVSDLQRRG
jgi:hypothetical protein